MTYSPYNPPDGLTYHPGPLIVMQLPADITVEWVRNALGHLEAYYDSQTRPVAFVVDARASIAVSSEIRRTFVEHEKAYAAAKKRLCAGIGFVLTNSLVRGMLSAVYWISPPAYPYTIVATVEEATKWAEARLYERKAAIAGGGGGAPGGGKASHI